MTTSERFYIPFTQLFTNLGVIGAGWKLKTYQTLTSTPKATYSDEGLTVANPTVIVADSAGRIGVDMWVADRSLYKLVMTDENDVVIQTTDPVDSSSGGSIIPFDPLPTAYWGTTSGGPISYTLNPALVAITSYSYKYCFFIDFNTACSAAPTLNVNNIGAVNLKKYTGQGTKAALLAGDVQSQRYLCIYDGVDFVILNPRTVMTYLGAPPTITVGTNTLTLTNDSSSYNVNTSSAAQTINTINGLVSGQTAIIGISSSSNPATFANGVGNIVNPGGFNSILTTVNDKLTIYNDGTNNIIISVSSAGGSPFQLIQSQTAASSSSISFVLPSSGFSSFKVIFNNVIPTVNGVILAMQFSIDGGSTWINANYKGIGNLTFGGSGVVAATTNAARIAINSADGSPDSALSNTASLGGLNGEVNLYNFSNSASNKWTQSQVSYPRSLDNGAITNVFGGTYTGATTAINAVRFITKAVNSDTNSGNVASGIFKLYGLV